MSAFLSQTIGYRDNAREAYSGATAFNFQLSLEGTAIQSLPHRGPQRGVLVSLRLTYEREQADRFRRREESHDVALKVLIRFA